MGKLTALVLATLMATGGIGQAQDNHKVEPKPPNPHPLKESDSKAGSGKMFFPIETQQAGTNKRPTQDYFYEGRKLRNFQELKEVIDPLNDSEASRLIKAAENKERVGGVFNVVGGLLVVGAVIYAFAAPGSTQTLRLPYGGGGSYVTPPDSTPIWVLGISGGLVEIIGLIFEGEAGGYRRDAVTRYNQIVESNQNLSMIFLPRTHLPGLELTQRF